MSRGALFKTPLKFDLGAPWCAGVIALLESQSLSSFLTYTILICFHTFQTEFRAEKLGLWQVNNLKKQFQV